MERGLGDDEERNVLFQLELGRGFNDLNVVNGCDGNGDRDPL
jgi:hypothetical protein